MEGMVMKLRAIRLDEDLIERMKKAAAREGIDVSEVHRRALVAVFGRTDEAIDAVKAIDDAENAPPAVIETPAGKRPNKATQKLQTRSKGRAQAKSPKLRDTPAKVKRSPELAAALDKIAASVQPPKPIKAAGPQPVKVERTREVQPNFKQKS